MVLCWGLRRSQLRHSPSDFCVLFRRLESSNTTRTLTVSVAIHTEKEESKAMPPLKPSKESNRASLNKPGQPNPISIDPASQSDLVKFNPIFSGQ